MAYIYQIINDVNNKIYIGKTQFSIEHRFKEHCNNIYREQCKERPLYRAMLKYGVEHFHIELLEETDNPEEREKYWIEQKGSFKYGYNATTGGDGRPYLDYDVLVAAYLELRSLEAVSKLYGCDTSYLSKILKSRNIRVDNNQTVNRRENGKCVNQYDLQDNYIKTFTTAHDAARELRPNSSSLGGVASHITDVCRGARKTAYGYKWKFSK